MKGKKGLKRDRDGNTNLDLERYARSFGGRWLENKTNDTTGPLPDVGRKITERASPSLDKVEKKTPQSERAMRSADQEPNDVSFIQAAVNNSIQTNTKQIFSQLGPSDPLSTSLASKELSNGIGTNYGDALFQNCLDSKLMNDAMQNYLLQPGRKTKAVNMDENRMLKNSQINFATNAAKSVNEEQNINTTLNRYSALQPQGNDNQHENTKKIAVNNGESNLLNDSSIPSIPQNEQFVAPLVSCLTAKPYGNVAVPSGNSEPPEDVTHAKNSKFGIPRGIFLNPQHPPVEKQVLNFGINPGILEGRPEELIRNTEVASVLNPSSLPNYNPNYHNQNMALIQQNDLFTKLQGKFSLATEPISSAFQNNAVSASLPRIRGNIRTTSEMSFNPLIKAQHHHLAPLSVVGGNASNANTASTRQDAQGSTDLYMRCDDDILSAHQILIRKQIEYFEAGTQEVQSVAHGRKKEIRMGQVGLRCKHCAVLPIKSRPRGAVYYPTSLRALYQAAQNMAVGHFVRSCGLIDQEVKQQLKTFKDSKASAGHGGKKYWADSAKALGIIETDRDLRFNSQNK